MPRTHTFLLEITDVTNTGLSESDETKMQEAIENVLPTCFAVNLVRKGE